MAWAALSMARICSVTAAICWSVPASAIRVDAKTASSRMRTISTARALTITADAVPSASVTETSSTPDVPIGSTRTSSTTVDGSRTTPFSVSTRPTTSRLVARASAASASAVASWPSRVSVAPITMRAVAT